MFGFLTIFADFCIGILGLDLNTNFGKAVHFFIEDSIKIFLFYTNIEILYR